MAKRPAWYNDVRGDMKVDAFERALNRKIMLPFKRPGGRGHKCPYAFNAKTMRDVLDYLLSNRLRYGQYFYAWKIKVYNVDFAHPKGEHKIDATLDAAWNAFMSKNSAIEELAFENARRQIVDNEWSSYPGDDQGDWEFVFEGRQGGWLVLDRWKGHKLSDYDVLVAFLGEHLASGEWAPVVQFYCGIVTADHDFTMAKASENVEWYVNDLRHEWEETRKGTELVRVLDAAMYRAATKTLADYGYEASEILGPIYMHDAFKNLAETVARITRLGHVS